MSHLIVYKTALPEIDVIVTNTIGNLTLASQWFVFEVDTSVAECPDHYGPFSSLEIAMERADQSVREIAIIASAVLPEDDGTDNYRL